jgi:hypothetical protein
MTSLFKIGITMLCVAGAFTAQGLAQSPAATASVSVKGAAIKINYNSPRVNGREGKLFGPGGRISQDPNYPIWRAGANSATKFHTEADLDIGGLAVPKGDYTLYVDLADPANWQLVINKKTGQWGLTYDKSQDLGRVKMTMSKPPALAEDLTYTLSATAGNKVQLALSWENVTASVSMNVK